MKLTIERASLLRSLAHVQSAVERRNAIPILSNVLIDVEGGNLSLTTTDMDIAMVDHTAVDSAEAGSTTAPVHTLYDIVRKLPDGAQVEMAFDSESNQLELRAGRSKFSLSCLPKEDFPTVAADEMPHSFELSAADLRALVDRTRFAISTEETRYYLNGIYWHQAEVDGVKFLRAAATDGHRLARVEMPLPEGADGMPGVIIPRKAVSEIYKLVDESDDTVTIGLSDTKIRFAVDNVVLTSKLIDGTFPDYERVIPTGNDKLLEVDRVSFHAAVDRVSTISTEKSRAVKVSLSDGVATLQATSPDAGVATEEVEVKYDGDAMEIGFNSRYLLEITQQIQGDAAQLSLADSVSPTIIRDMADESALYVLMPMRV